MYNHVMCHVTVLAVPECTDQSPCQNGGTCYDHGDNGLRCVCVEPWSGQFCDIPGE